MMKKYIWSAIVGLSAFACNNETYEPAFRDYAGINSSGLATSIPENNSAGIKIPVIFGGAVTNDAAFNITYEITGGTYGENYTVVGGSGSTGTLAIPAGGIGDATTGFITIKGVPDFDNEPDVPLTITLKSADRDVRLGYPFKNSLSFTLKDDDCLFDFTGDLEGVEANIDGLELEEENTVTVTDSGDGEYTIEGIGQAMISDFWGEAVTAATPVVMKVALGGAITIDEQPVFTTDYQGDPYDYLIKGTGQVNYCDGTISITYDIYYADGSGSVAEYAATNPSDGPPFYMSTPLFEATFAPVEPEDE